MTEQKKRLTESAEYIKRKFGIKERIHTAIICYRNSGLIKSFKHIKKIKYQDIPPAIISENKKNDGELILASHKSGGQLFIMNGRFHFYEGYSMRDAAHFIYTLKMLGVKNLISINDSGFLNPRFKTGEVAFIYDHINLMGTNPLIGENDNSLGPRFPDMSNAYDSALYTKIEEHFIDNSFRYYPSVYVGITGPETETEAECRFYREIGGDIVGYALIPENLAAVHAGMKCAAFSMLTRELVADRLCETSREELLLNRIKAEKKFSKLLTDIVELI